MRVPGSAGRQAAVLFLCVLSAFFLLGTGFAQAQTPPKSAPKQDLLALPEEKPIHGMGWPSLSPDGKTLCFTYLGDLWTVSATGGNATRLTVHEGLDAYSRWSPDGKWIAFTTMRNGNADVYLIPSSGGEARQVTYHSGNDWLNDWSPDGTKLLFYSVRDTKTFSLFSIDLRTHALKQLSHDEEATRFAAWSPDGKTVAYSRGGMPWWRPWYRGSMAASTVLEDIETSKVKTLFKTNGQQFWPLFAPDGKSVFVAMIYGKESNTPNLWRVPVGSDPKPVTKYTTDAVRYPSIARNGSLLTYLWNGDLYTIKPDGTDAKKVRILAASDDKVNNQERLPLNQFASELELAPDGKTLALEIRGEIWTIPPTGGEAKRITDNPANDGDIHWSPDGDKLVMVSDRENQPNLYLVDVKSKAVTWLTSDADSKSGPIFSPDGKYIAYAKAGSAPGLYIISSTGGQSRRLAEGNGNNDFGNGIISFTWSPDSRWVAFTRMDRTHNRDIWVVPAVGGTAVNITRYPGNNIEPKFTKDGRRLLFVSDRNGPILLFQVPLESEDDTPQEEEGKPRPRPDRSKDVKIDFADIHLRARQITPPLGNVEDYMPTPDSQKVVVHIGSNFWLAGIADRQAQMLAPAGDQDASIRILPDGSRFFYLSTNGSVRSLALTGGAPSTVTFTANMLFDHRATYQQAFNEFYRRFGAGFYDPKLHGVDWKSLRAKYEPLLQGVATPEEFANLLSMMVGEVNSSHSEITAASQTSGPKTASLGLFFDESYAGPGLKVTGLLPKGPADKPSTRIMPGEYVLSVDGTDVSLTEEYYQTLQDKAGKTVELTVNAKPTKDGARTIKIRPVGIAEWMNLDYEQTVRRNRERVDRLSSNRLAYLHFRQFDQTSLRRLERELWSDAMEKDGLILDIRGNGGGDPRVSDAILDLLSRRVYGYTQPRDGLRETQPVRVWTKPVTLLMAQNSMSAAEAFPEGFRALKLGKIIGVPTPGYLIGTYEGTLVDGTGFRLPSWGYYTLTGKNMENLGVTPDILVENTPEELAAGHDRQLETAVQTLLKELPYRSETAASGFDIQGGANANPNGGSSAVRPRASDKQKQ